MAGLDLGGLLGAASQASTALSKPRSLKTFLKTINKFGVQVKNNFEVNFSGLQDVTFFVQNIEIPGYKQNMATVNYDGHVIDVPVNYDWEHGWSMTVLNDAQGYIYPALKEFIASTAQQALCPNGYTMTVRALTGDTGSTKYKGSLITMTGVRITQVGGLSFGQEDNSIQTFTISGLLTEITVSPGAAAKAAGLIGAVNSILG